MVPNVGKGCDCGVFVCMYADFIANDYPMIFTQADMDASRERITVEILKMSTGDSPVSPVELDESD